jgi:hypothetical protein
MNDRVRLGQAVQFGLACVLGSAAWLAYGDTGNPYERLLAALIAGFGGQWAAVFVWVWVRHGLAAARGITMDCR